MLGVGPMNFSAPEKPKKPKTHARGATIPGPSTPGSIQAPSTPGSVPTGFGGFINAHVPRFPETPQLPSTPSLQTTGSFDSSHFNTIVSDGSTGTKKSGGFFRLFKKDSRSDGARSDENLSSRGRHLYGRSEELTIDAEPFDPLAEMGTLPTPDFIRPVPGQRLVPRRELNPLPTSSPLGNTQIGRARARAAERLTESISEVAETEGAESDWQTTTDWHTITDGDEEQSALADSSFYDETSQDFNFTAYIEEQHESIAEALAPAGDKAAMVEWFNYIKSYSGGSYNMSNPPAPPPRRAGFSYLPAMFPQNEEARIRKHHSIDAPWTPELSGKIGLLMGAAAKRFDVGCASVSVFDENIEKLRATGGFNLTDIERTTSIAAHVLYSEEFLIILDTHQDWRFAENPWVTDSPHIRFFVGAPLISDAGETIGVFSIFSKKPRSEFVRGDRRELAEFAALMTKEISLWTERMMDPDLRRSYAFSKRDTRTNLVPNPLHLQKQPSSQAFFPGGLRFQRHPSPLAKQFGFYNEDVFMNTSNSSMSMSHESSIRDSDILYMAAPRHHRRFSAESILPNDNSPEAFRQYLTPTQSQNFPGEDRPYSTSDLTSVDMPQNNTPNDTFNSDYQFDLDGPTTPKQPKFVFPNSMYRNLGPSASGFSLNNSFGRLYMEGDSMAESTYHQELGGPEVATSSPSLTRAFSTMSSTSIGTSYSSRIGGPNSGDENAPPSAPRSNIAEANFSCSFNGRNSGFDQVYAVQVDCPYPGMSEQQLLGPNGLSLKVLASYGLPLGYESELNKKVYLKKAFLRGLRTDEFCYKWTQEDDMELQEQGCLGSGVLIPLSPFAMTLSPNKGITRSHDHGIVFALFNKATFDANNKLQPTFMNPSDLKQLARSITMILFNLENKDVESPPPQRLMAPRQGTPTIIGATEVGNIYYSRRTSSAYSRHHSSF